VKREVYTDTAQRPPTPLPHSLTPSLPHSLTCSDVSVPQLARALRLAEDVAHEAARGVLHRTAQRRPCAQVLRQVTGDRE
jgi:hypothetical protein